MENMRVLYPRDFPNSGHCLTVAPHLMRAWLRLFGASMNPKTSQAPSDAAQDRPSQAPGDARVSECGKFQGRGVASNLPFSRLSGSRSRSLNGREK